MLVYVPGCFNHGTDSDASPKIRRRWNHRHKPEVSNQQCALGYGRVGRRGTVNDDEIVIANELLHLTVKLSVGIGQTSNAGREGGFIGRRSSPTCGGALWIRINNQNLETTPGQCPRKVHDRCGFTGATFLVDDSNDFSLAHMVLTIYTFCTVYRVGTVRL